MLKPVAMITSPAWVDELGAQNVLARYFTHFAHKLALFALAWRWGIDTYG